MSFSDSEGSSHGPEYKSFGNVTRDRLLHDMLGAAKSGDSKAWKVLIMDKVTVKVMSSSCKMADITDQGVSLVEDLFRRRQPLPSMDAIYFVQPSKENVIMFLSDMSGRVPLYRKAYVFFSASVPKDLINHIKCDTSVLPRIGALREMNLEYFPIDSQGFVTDHERALEELFGENVANTRKFDACLSVMAARIATVFASLNELPSVWYHSAKDEDESNFRAQNPPKLAAALYDILSKYKAIPNFPQKETCDLLILDRSIDLIAPVIHEWTYDAMCHDLLDMDGNKYVYEAPSKAGGGKMEKKEVLLESHDPVWLELRHSHIADASEKLSDKMTNFVNKNKAAQIQRQSKDGAELSTRDLQKVVQSLGQYGDIMEKLSSHVEIAGKINGIIRESGLRDLGQLEQDLVFGDAGAKDVISYLRTNADASPENKLRLLMIYALVYPEKFEGDKATKLMQLAKLSPDDMKVVHNMQLLAGANTSKNKKAQSGGFSLKFDGQKTKGAARKDRSGEEEETWQLSRFYPMIEELIENLNKCELPKNEYACMSDQNLCSAARKEADTKSVRSSQAPAPAVPERKAPAQSRRSRRTATWAKSDDGSSGDSALHPSVDFRKLGQRMFVFIIGGATRSELRTCHKMTAKLRREVILGSTSFDDPPQYITKLKLFGEPDLSMDMQHGFKF